MNVPLILSLAALVATILSLAWIRSELRFHQRQIDTLHDAALARGIQDEGIVQNPVELIEVDDVTEMEQAARRSGAGLFYYMNRDAIYRPSSKPKAAGREEEERLGRTLLHSLGWSSGSSNPYADLNRIHWQRSEELEAKVKSREES